MPTYDYTCLDCNKRFDIFMSYKDYGVRPVACSHCGSANVRRRPPRVRVMKSAENRLDALSDPAALEAMGDDPRAMAKAIRELGSASGEEMPPQFNEIVDRLDAGQSPDEIEKSIPDWGESMGTQSFGGHDHEHSHDHSDE